MRKPVVLIGLGEMGGVFARGLLKAGYAVVPINRQDSLANAVEICPHPKAVVVAVGEKDLDSVLIDMPEEWRDKLVLLQNELLPHDWQKHDLDPTVISVWFEKKPGQDVKVIIPSPVYGPQASLIRDTLTTIDIQVAVLTSVDDLLKELIIKNLYILTVNIAGLALGGGTVEQLWKEHEGFARDVAHNVLDIQFAVTQTELHREVLIEKMVDAFAGDWQHKCMGRSAPARLQRAIDQADTLGLDVATMRNIADKHLS